jgi:hypothetical protein
MGVAADRRQPYRADQSGLIAMPLFWLSFYDADLPKERQFIGALIVEASPLDSAIQESYVIGLNPDFATSGAEIQKDCPRPPDEFIGRYLSKADAQHLETLLTN